MANEQSIMLNRIKVDQWDFERIDKDFDVYQVILDKHADKNILDIPSDIKILSTVYYSGQQCFIMTHRGKTDEVTLQYLFNKELKGGNLCAVHLVRTKMLAKRQEAFRKMFGYRGRALLQLLINSTLNSIFEEDEYNNITGRCYYWNPAWNENPKTKIELVDLTIERDMVMYPSVCTFTKEKPKEGRFPSRIVYDRLNNVIRKVLSSDKAEDIYYKQGIDGTHSTRPYDGTTLQYWELSRLSCLAKFYRFTKKELAQYANFSFEIQEVSKQRPETFSDSDDNIISILKESGICLVDSIQFSEKELTSASEKQGILKQWITDSKAAYEAEIRQYCEQHGIAFMAGEHNFFSLNLEVIRDSKFYDINKKELKDVYASKGKVVCQHITVPVNYKNKKGEIAPSFLKKMKTVYKELAIKADVRDTQIRVVDWSQYNVRRPYTFYISQVCTSDQDAKKGMRTVRFTGMTIQPDGSFETDAFLIENIKDPVYENSHQRTIAGLFISSNGSDEYYDRNIELVIIPDEDIEDAHIIRKTNVRAMSNILEMEKDFMSERKDVELDCATIIDAIRPLQNDGNPGNVEVYRNIMCAVQDRETILKSEVLPLLTPPLREGQKKAKISTKAKEMLLNATGVIFQVSRSTSEEKRLGTSAYKDISVWHSLAYDMAESQDEEPSVVTNYAVGQYDKALNEKIATSPVVRQLYRKDGAQCQPEEEMFILSLLQVGFVRMKNYTVLPFPAKYLREM